jgi:transcriptional regulator with XRE-family HTH domain
VSKRFNHPYNLAMAITKDQDIVIKFSKRIRALRKELDLTQEQLSERSDISYKNIQYLESKNPTCPNLRTLNKLAKGFGLPLSELLEI